MITMTRDGWALTYWAGHRPLRNVGRSLWITATALALVGLSTGAQAQTSYYGLYMEGSKIGSVELKVEPFHQGDDIRYRLSTESAIAIEMMGTKVEQRTTVVSLCDSTMSPLTQEYSIVSGQSALKLNVKYRSSFADVVITSGETKSTKRLTVPRGARIAADSSLLNLGERPKVGSRATVYYLNPLTISIDKAVVTVEALETLLYAGKETRAYRSLSRTPMGDVRAWETEGGELLWADMPFGMSMYRLDREAAADPKTPLPAIVRSNQPAHPKAEYSPPADFAISTAAKVDRPIPNARRLRRAVIEIGGLPASYRAISDVRQRVTLTPGSPQARVFEVTSRSGSKDVRLPVRDRSLRQYLGTAPLVDPDSSDVRGVARSLTDRTSARRTASRIRAWVFKNMTPDYSIGVPRSSSDVLRRKRGVCRDYAVLFAALARAAGIPTRLCGGIVYADTSTGGKAGMFFYHAWVECWLGEWVAFDATVPSDFVDATHIKLSQGNPDDMMGVTNLIGRIRVRVREP